MTFYTFANSTTAIPLSNLDSNFATPITLGNTAVTINGTFSSIGNLTLNNATIASGNITVTNETVTTITSPAATNLTIQSAGTTAMTIDTSQNVGIGTASPAYKLHVYGGSGASVVYSSATAGQVAYVSVAGNGNTFGSTSFDMYQDGSSTGVVNNRANSPLIFGTNNSERMRIDSSGNVGIGTTSPGAILQVNSTAAIVRPIVTGTTGFTDWVVANNSGNLYMGIDNSVGGISGTAYGRHIYSDGAYPLDFFTNSTQRMRIDASGNVGIGTTSVGAGTIVDVQSTTKGVRFPNMTTAQKTAITPAAGTVVFDTTLAKLCVYSGSAWQTITSV